MLKTPGIVLIPEAGIATNAAAIVLPITSTKELNTK